MKTQALDWQRDIYLNGFAGRTPIIPTDYKTLEQTAQRILHPKAFAYIAGAAGNESTLRENAHAFERCQIIPRMLRNVSEADTSIELFGKKYPSPFLLSPVGVLELAHAEADLAVAKAAAHLGVPYIFSNQASFSMETCSAEMKDSPRWFQLYWSKSEDLVASFLSRAEKCGCHAIVVTLDTTMLGWRTRDLDLAYLPFLEGKGIAQYTSDPVFLKMLDEPDVSAVKRKITVQSIQGLISIVNRYPGKGFVTKLRSGKPLKAVRKFIETYSNARTTWDDLKRLRQYTKLPIVLKGILHRDDALKAVDFGMDGIIVSNHGGRQVDGAIASFDELPRIIKNVPSGFPVLLDSGVRGGADAFKALASGAKAVCIGRPYVYALALAGEDGVYTLLRHYLADFELTMRLSGCKNVKEINTEFVAQ